MKIYALIEDGEVVDFRERDEISSEEWKQGKWLIVKDNAQNVDTDKYHISSDFEIKVLRTKVIKTHEIVPLNKRTRKIIAQL